MAKECRCYQSWYTSGLHGRNDNCTCFQAIDREECILFQKFLTYKSSSPLYMSCACNVKCYLESLGCSCNSTNNMETRDKCTCNQSCDGYVTCNIDGCEEYTPCQCDGVSDRFPCAQCDHTQYDPNGPIYYCPCNAVCDNFEKPRCNCDGSFQHIMPERCHIHTMADECKMYTENIDWNYVFSRYY